MHKGRIVFAQLMDFLPRFAFDQCVERYHGNRKIRTFSCQDQFLCMAFAQLTRRESLRDIEISLRSVRDKLYHAGIRGKVSRSTLADANEHRDWRIYADVANILIARARRSCVSDNTGLNLDEPVYAFDSTTVDLCLTLFPWARFRKRKAAIKLHTLLDLKGSIPYFISLTDGTVHDVNLLDRLPVEGGAYYVMDRGYLDFARLFAITQAGAFFVIRSKSNLRYVRLESFPIDAATEICSDQRIRLRTTASFRSYPYCLRRTVSADPNTGKRVVLLSNQFNLPAEVTALLYKRRWRIELFFKWIKQNLRICAFFGTSINAVQTQIWIAVCVYCLLVMLKKPLKLPHSLAEIHTILSINLFQKTPVAQLFTISEPPKTEQPTYNPLLFNDI